MKPTFTGNEGHREQSDNLLFIGLLRRNFRNDKITIGASATKIPSSPLDNRKIIIIQGATRVIYIGNSAVTTANGFPIYPRGVISVQIEDGVDVYGIASENTDIRIIEGA